MLRVLEEDYILYTLYYYIRNVDTSTTRMQTTYPPSIQTNFLTLTRITIYASYLPPPNTGNIGKIPLDITKSRSLVPSSRTRK